MSFPLDLINMKHCNCIRLQDEKEISIRLKKYETKEAVRAAIIILKIMKLVLYLSE